MLSAKKAAPVHAVILAGGAGERFWPASRRARPKPFLEVIGGRSLLDATLARARAAAGSADRVWIVCGHEHAAAVRRESGLPAKRVLVEPARRNTAMAIAWVAHRIAAEDPDAVMAVLPADHHVPDERAFARCIRRAARAAAGASVLVTLGVQPTRPDTGYGYIRVGDAAAARYRGLSVVDRFVEKPEARVARRYLSDGGYLWNAGIFVWSARVLLEEVEACAPELHEALEPFREAPRNRSRALVDRVYAGAPSLPIDIAVLERSRRVWTLPVAFAWSDVGTWESIAVELGVGQERAGRRKHPLGTNRVIAGELLAEGASGNLVWGGKRLVALVGVEDLAVVDTDDVILVTKLSDSHDVRRLVARLHASDRSELT